MHLSCKKLIKGGAWGSVHVASTVNNKQSSQLKGNELVINDAPPSLQPPVQSLILAREEDKCEG